MLKTKSQSKITASEKCKDQLEKEQPVQNKEGIHNPDEVLQTIEKEIRLLHDWTTEQKRDLPCILNERKRLVELNLKCNSLVHENSLLNILNEKLQLINDKYKQNVKMQVSPLRSTLRNNSIDLPHNTRYSSCGSN